MTATIEILWEELLVYIKQSSNFESLTSKSTKNIAFMKKMGFADVFVELAKVQRGIAYEDIQIDWMYSWLQRQNRFFELRPKMLPIGDDGRGNYIYIYDVSKPNSQIIYMSHDPAVLMVIASSMEEFLLRIITIIKEKSTMQEIFSTFMETYGFSDAAMKIYKKGVFNGAEDNLGFNYKKISDVRVHADFSTAKSKSGISLAFFGKYSEIYYTNLTDVVVIENMNDNDLSVLKRKDKKSFLFFAILLPFSYFLLGLFQLTPSTRIALIVGTLFFLPWMFDFIRFIRKHEPRL